MTAESAHCKTGCSASFAFGELDHSIHSEASVLNLRRCYDGEEETTYDATARVCLLHVIVEDDGKCFEFQRNSKYDPRSLKK